MENGHVANILGSIVVLSAIGDIFHLAYIGAIIGFGFGLLLNFRKSICFFQH